jgi:DNA-binding PadR family transcriptional regulator
MFAFRQFRFGKRGWLRPWVLSVLGRSPKNGAELIDEIEKMSFGGWRPSPGSVYPLLEDMSQEGLIHRMPDGRYELTDKGRQEVEWPFGAPMQQGKNSVDAIIDEMRDNISYLEDLGKSNPAKLTSLKDKIRELSERLSRLSS